MQRKRYFIILDDHPIFRQGLASLIELNDNFCSCTQAGTINEAIEALNKDVPDLILADIGISNQNGLNFICNIKRSYPELPVLIISTYDERIYAERSLKAGARGYIMKQAASSAVLHAIHTVLGGKIYISESMRDRLIENIVSPNHTNTLQPSDALSEREIDVLEYIGGGYGVSEIARFLYLSVKTINTYRDHIKEKLQLENAAEIRRFAIQWLQARSS